MEKEVVWANVFWREYATSPMNALSLSGVSRFARSSKKQDVSYKKTILNFVWENLLCWSYVRTSLDRNGDTTLALGSGDRDFTTDII